MTFSELKAENAMLREQVDNQAAIIASSVMPADQRQLAMLSELDALRKWKEEALTVESWWAKIANYVRAHPDASANLGWMVSDIALAWLKERDTLKAENAKLRELRAAVMEFEDISEDFPEYTVPQTRFNSSFARLIAAVRNTRLSQ